MNLNLYTNEYKTKQNKTKKKDISINVNGYYYRMILVNLNI